MSRLFKGLPREELERIDTAIQRELAIDFMRALLGDKEIYEVMQEMEEFEGPNAPIYWGVLSDFIQGRKAEKIPLTEYQKNIIQDLKNQNIPGFPEIDLE